MRRGKIKIIVPFHYYPKRNKKFKNNSKKIQKKKKTILASFQAKIGWNRPRKRENKIIIPFRSYPKRNRKFQKNSRKIRKIKNYHYGFISLQNRLEKAEKERKEKLSFRFVPS